MYILLDSLLRDSDIFAAPVCFVVLLMIFSVIISKYKEDRIRNLFIQAFYFKMACALIFTLVNTFYYRGGDTEMYYNCTKYLHDAVMDDTDNFLKIYQTKGINVKTPLMNYFIFKETIYPEFEAMHDAGNFLVPKFGLPVMLVFGKSYLVTAMFFSFFALGGSIRLFKFFNYYFPAYWREIALATLFLPSAAYWSSGIMKDPICFGCVGYIVYGFYKIFIKRKGFVYSIFWIVLCGTLLYYVKPYILLALLPGIVIWLFTELNKTVENKTLRRIMGFLTFSLGAGMAFLMINYVTSDASLKSFQLDTIIETSNTNREIYQDISIREKGAYFAINTSNAFLLVLNGIVATLFRPFIWEINGPTALLSALEAAFFLFFTLLIIFKKGLVTFFRNAFSHPVFIMCFIFSFVFAAAIGSTALNFGSLSRYKIPCLPFYLIMVMIIYRTEGLNYPAWLNRILGYRTIQTSQKKTAV
jgi:hypothetical protein